MKKTKSKLNRLALIMLVLLGTTALAMSQEAPDIIFQTDNYGADSTTIDWMRLQSLTVLVDTMDAYRDKILSQQEIDELNAADLIIISRETNSSDFKAEEVGIGLAQVTTPVLCQNAFAVRNSRMKLFNSANLVEGAQGDSIYFSGIHSALLNNIDSALIDTTNWTYIVPEGTENFTLLANTTADGGVLIAEFEAGKETYTDGYVPGGKWVFFAPKGQEDGEISYTEEGKLLYMNLINYMIGNTDYIEMADIIWQVRPDKYSLDHPTVEMLRGENYTVFVDTTDTYFDKELSQQEINELNAAKLIIISPNANSFDHKAEEVGMGMMQVTTPVLVQSAYVARDSKMKLINSEALADTAGVETYFMNIDPNLLATDNVIIDNNNIKYIVPEGTENYTLLADALDDNGILIAEFEAGVETYPGGYTPGSDWVFFAPKGTNDDAEVTFTEEGIQLYKNLVKYMMGTKDIVWQVRPDKYDMDHTTIEWLRTENYSVLVDTTFTYFDKELTQQDIDELNAMDLIIISPNANSFDHKAEEVGIGMAQVTTPVLVQSAYVARSSKMRLINTETLADTTGSATYFTNINDHLLTADSVLIDYNNIKYIVPTGTENYTLLADALDDLGLLIAEFKAGVETYPEGFTPGGNWVFFAPKGANDDAEVTFTEAGKELYLNLLTYMITPPVSDALPAPENLIATVDQKDVTLAWDPVSGALAYNVYRDDALVGDSISEVTFSDMGLEDALYTYGVKAVDSAGVESEEVAIVRAEVLTTPVTPVLLFINVSNNNVQLSWPPAIRAVAYNVYRGDDKIAEAITTVNFTDEGLENGTYTYSVTSLNVFDVESGAVTGEATVDYDTTNIDELAEIGISIYPNPFQSELFIDSKIEITSLRVLNINGQIVRHELNDNKLKIINAEKGIYFIEINNAIIKKVFKN